MKLTKENLTEMHKKDDIKNAFLKRKDISNFTKDEQENEWKKHSECLDDFFSTISQIGEHIV